MGSPDFSREIGKSGQFVSVDGRHIRKERPGQLHAIARISCKTNNNIFDINYFVLHLF